MLAWALNLGFAAGESEAVVEPDVPVVIYGGIKPKYRGKIPKEALVDSYIKEPKKEEEEVVVLGVSITKKIKLIQKEEKASMNEEAKQKQNQEVLKILASTLW